MKRVMRKIAGVFGSDTSEQQFSSENRQRVSIESFHSDHYLRHTARRLEHLASLRIAVSGLRVLEVGAGIGDHTSYYLDRGCDVTITEARAENIANLKLRFPEQKIFHLDLEKPEPITGAPFEAIHCYGLLYHLKNPEQALKYMSDSCSGMLFLETCVSFGYEKAIHVVDEPQSDPTQAVSGQGCRPTRVWIFGRLKERFPYVYCPVTQPNHEEFPLDWNAPEKHQTKFGLQRSVFVASRKEIASDVLSRELVDVQTRF